MKKATFKTIQHHIQCICGYNEVDQSTSYVKYKEFKEYGIRRKIDKKNGGYFLLKIEKYNNCYNCTPNL